MSKCDTSSHKNCVKRNRHEEIKDKEEKRTILEKKNPEGYRHIKKGSQQNRNMVSWTMEKNITLKKKSC